MLDTMVITDMYKSPPVTESTLLQHIDTRLFVLHDTARGSKAYDVLCIARIFTEFREGHKAHLKLSLFPKKVKHIESRQYL